MGKFVSISAEVYELTNCQCEAFLSLTLPKFPLNPENTRVCLCKQMFNTYVNVSASTIYICYKLKPAINI